MPNEIDPRPAGMANEIDPRPAGMANEIDPRPAGMANEIDPRPAGMANEIDPRPAGMANEIDPRPAGMANEIDPRPAGMANEIDPRPAGMANEIDPRVRRDIAEHGWHVVKVREDDVGPAHAFSIGLHETHGHPEIVVTGPDLDVLHRLVNALGEDVRDGRRFAADRSYEGIVAGLRCHFRAVHVSNYPDFLGYAGWYYGGAGFAALQCVWPDPDGRFPWEPGFPAELAAWQPDLGQPRR